MKAKNKNTDESKGSRPLRFLVRLFKILFKGIAGLIGVIILVILICVGLMWMDHFRHTALPLPSGTYPVGRTTFLWKDSNQVDSMSPKPLIKRQLVAWVWYPATKKTVNGPFAPYLPPEWLKAVKQQRGVLISQVLTRDLSRISTHSFLDTQIAERQQTYPVILLRAGLAALVTNYSSLAEDLASHGYVVVGVDAPYRSSVVVLPGGNIIHRSSENDADQYSGAKQEQVAEKLVCAWSSDMSFALDRLAVLNASDPTGKFRGRLNLKKIGIFGHSLGGATALKFCHDDPRCKAGIDIDGAPLGTVIKQGVPQPFLFLIGDHGDESDPETREVLANVRTVDQGQNKEQKFWIKLSGSNHFGFSDDGALLKSPVMMHLLNFLGIVPMDGRKQLAITCDYLNGFFDTFLKQPTGSTFKIPNKYQEVKQEQ